jgi:LCP family protein required for cell wall assembly
MAKKAKHGRGEKTFPAQKKDCGKTQESDRETDEKGSFQEADKPEKADTDVEKAVSGKMDRPEKAECSSESVGTSVQASEQRISSAEPSKEPELPTEPEKLPSKKAQGKLPRWGKVLLIVGGVLIALILLAGLYINGKLDLIRYSDGSIETAGSIDANEDQDLNASGLTVSTAEMAMADGSPFAASDVLNVLLIGTDERTEAVNDAAAFTHLDQLDGTADTTEYSDTARADSLILVSLNIQKDTIKLVSIERATGVPIELPEYKGQYDWITHTFAYGGAKLTMDTVEDCFNVEVNHYVRINFNSFVEIVNAVGGVDLTLTEDEAAAMNWEVPSNTMLIVNKVHAGKNHFDGYTALQYARLRTIDSDWHRIERQRTVIQAVLDSIKELSVADLDGLMNNVLPLLQTNFTKSEITALLVQLPGFIGVKTEQMSLPAEGSYGVRYGMDNRQMYDPDWTENIRILHDFLYESASDADTYPNGSTDESAAVTGEYAATPPPAATPKPRATAAPLPAAADLAPAADSDSGTGTADVS